MNLNSLLDLVSMEKFSNAPIIVEPSKVYYGNVCNKCFISSSPLKKCASCKIVSYCSRNHQVMDWRSHKGVCMVLKNATEKLNLTPNCSFEDFTKFREDLASELNKSSFSNPEFIKQISQFPWVCSVCYSRENLKFICTKCESVVYCSSEHMLQDEDHALNCDGLKLCKIFDSLFYENGFRAKFKKFVFEDVPRSIKFFPKSMPELSCLIQKQLNVVKKENMQDMISYIMHNDTYAPASTILYALEMIGLLHKRVFTKKPFLSKKDRERRFADRIVQQMMYDVYNKGMPHKPAMVIHIVAADNYEISFQWTPFIGLLTHWMINIDYIEFVLVGQALQKCQEPDFESLRARSSYQCHPVAYKDIVKKLVSPDLIILFNYGENVEKTTQFEEYESQRALFKIKNIPLLITSTKKTSLENFVEKLLELPGVQVQVNTQANPFAESRPHRIWKEKHISTYVRNQFLAVLTRH